jgi:hypothetical protein
MRHHTYHYVPSHAIQYHTVSFDIIPYRAVTYLPFPTVPYRTVPYRTIPNCTELYPTLPYRTLPYATIPYNAMQYIKPNQSVPYHIVPYGMVWSIPYRTVRYHTIPYETTPYHTIQNHNKPYHIRQYCEIVKTRSQSPPPTHKLLLMTEKIGDKKTKKGRQAHAPQGRKHFGGISGHNCRPRIFFVCLLYIVPEGWRRSGAPSSQKPVGKFLVPDWRDIVDSSIGLPYRLDRLLRASEPV